MLHSYDQEAQGGKIAKALGSMAAGISALKGHQGTLYALSANAEAAAARVTDTDFARSSANKISKIFYLEPIGNGDGITS